MVKKRKNISEDPLVRLVSAAERDVLEQLILELAAEGPGIRRKCLDYVNRHTVLPTDQKEEAEGEVLMDLWMELVADLSELDEYGGGDHRTEDHVSELLYELGEKLKICMYRKDFDQALATLQKMGPPGRHFDDGYALKVAQTLEERFPKEILLYYRSGLGNLKVNLPRRQYAAKAAFMAKVRHMFVDVLKSPQDWEAFAGPIKIANIRRPAFQEEMARVVAGWRDLG